MPARFLKTRTQITFTDHEPADTHKNTWCEMGGSVQVGTPPGDTPRSFERWNFDCTKPEAKTNWQQVHGTAKAGQ